MSQLDILRHDRDGVAVLALRGILDVNTVQHLRDSFLVILDEGLGAVVDMRHLVECDSTGFAALVGGLKKLRRDQLDLVLVCNGAENRAILRMMEVLGLLRLFVVVGSVDEAISQPAN